MTRNKENLFFVQDISRHPRLVSEGYRRTVYCRETLYYHWRVQTSIQSIAFYWKLSGHQTLFQRRRTSSTLWSRRLQTTTSISTTGRTRFQRRRRRGRMGRPRFHVLLTTVPQHIAPYCWRSRHVTCRKVQKAGPHGATTLACALGYRDSTYTRVSTFNRPQPSRNVSIQVSWGTSIILGVKIPWTSSFTSSSKRWCAYHVISSVWQSYT